MTERTAQTLTPQSAVARVGPARLVVIAMLCGYFGLLAGSGGYSHWNRLGVATGGLPVYLDLRSLTSAWECDRRGIDPFPDNPCDPLHRPANYPRIWIAASFLGLGDDDVVGLGVVVDVIFFVAALAVLSRNASPSEGVVYGLALVSPAVMLGVARANVDLVLFALVVAAILVAQRSVRASIAGYVMLLGAAVLKLFPIFAIAGLRRRRHFAGLVVVVALFAVYLLVTLDDIRTIERVTPQVDSLSYGVRLFGDWAAGNATFLSAHAWDLAALAIVGVTSAFWGFRLRRDLGSDAVDPSARRDLDLFWAGAAVYACTYALFRSFDYRLAFLLLTLPQLMRWMRAGRVESVATLAVLFCTLWLGPWAGVPSGVKALTQLLLFGALVASLTATLPGRRPSVGL